MLDVPLEVWVEVQSERNAVVFHQFLYFRIEMFDTRVNRHAT